MKARVWDVVVAEKQLTMIDPAGETKENICKRLQGQFGQRLESVEERKQVQTMATRGPT